VVLCLWKFQQNLNLRRILGISFVSLEMDNRKRLLSALLGSGFFSISIEIYANKYNLIFAFFVGWWIHSNCNCCPSSCYIKRFYNNQPNSPSFCKLPNFRGPHSALCFSVTFCVFLQSGPNKNCNREVFPTLVLIFPGSNVCLCMRPDCKLHGKTKRTVGTPNIFKSDLKTGFYTVFFVIL